MMNSSAHNSTTINIAPLISIIQGLPISEDEKQLCVDELNQSPTQKSAQLVAYYLYQLMEMKQLLAKHFNKEAKYHQHLADVFKKILSQ